MAYRRRRSFGRRRFGRRRMRRARVLRVGRRMG